MLQQKSEAAKKMFLFKYWIREWYGEQDWLFFIIISMY